MNIQTIKQIMQTIFLKSTVIFKNLSVKFKTKLKYMKVIKTQKQHKHNLKAHNIYIYKYSKI